MMKIKPDLPLTMAFIIATFSLGGCQTQNEVVLVGPVVGMGTDIGPPLAGGVFANAVYRARDPDDICEANRAFVTSTRAPLGKTIYWTNVRTGNWGYYKPLQDGHTRFDGQYCREYLSQSVINGRIERVEGVACRQPDGTWSAI